MGKGAKHFWTQGAGSFLVAIGIALTIRWALIEAYVIPSGSMLPSLLIHDHIFVNKLLYGIRIPFSENWMVKFRDPERGEVIVFKFPLDKSTFYIKRVVGVPGDKVLYREGDLWINDKLVERVVPNGRSDFEWLRDDDFQRKNSGFELRDEKDNYVPWEEQLGEHPHTVLLRKDYQLNNMSEPIVVPEGKLFVLGDNRNNSADSRIWKFVPMENVLGRAMFVWLSCEETLSFLPMICDPTQVRWKRFFHVIHP